MKIKTSKLTGAALDYAVGMTGEYGVGFFSTDWSQGGPIIEKEGIAVARNPTEWCAYRPDGLIHSAIRWTGKKTGPTPLIAAMRCFVASRLGDEVDVPDGLQQAPQAMTEAQTKAIQELRDAGYAVVVWTPDELEDGQVFADEVQTFCIENAHNTLFKNGGLS